MIAVNYSGSNGELQLSCWVFIFLEKYCRCWFQRCFTFCYFCFAQCLREDRFCAGLWQVSGKSPQLVGDLLEQLDVDELTLAV